VGVDEISSVEASLVLQAELLRTTGTGPTRSSPAVPDRVRRDVALVAVFVAALVGCTPSTAPVPLPPSHP